MRNILHSFFKDRAGVCNIKYITQSKKPSPILFEPGVKFEMLEYTGFSYLVVEGLVDNVDSLIFHPYKGHSIACIIR